MTRTPDPDCLSSSKIAEETKDSSLRSREQVKARRGNRVSGVDKGMQRLPGG